MNCDICKQKMVDKEDGVKNLVVFETKSKDGQLVGWRKIFNKICCDNCYDRIVKEAKISDFF